MTTLAQWVTVLDRRGIPDIDAVGFGVQSEWTGRCWFVIDRIDPREGRNRLPGYGMAFCTGKEPGRHPTPVSFWNWKGDRSLVGWLCIAEVKREPKNGYLSAMVTKVRGIERVVL